MRAWAIAVAVIVVVGTLLGQPSTASAERIYGAVVMDGARPLKEKGRYRSVKDWDRTTRFYRRVYGSKKGYVWREIATTPRVRAVHLENTNKRRTWDGINIYQSRGKVYMYYLKSSTEGAQKK